MDCNKFLSIVKKYKKCPECGETWKGDSLQVELFDDVVEIDCTCGFHRTVDENNKEIK